MSGPRITVSPCSSALRITRGGTKRTLRSGRFNAYQSYRTPGIPFTNTGFEPSSRTVIASRGVYLISLTVYLIASAGNPRFIQVFDCKDTNAIVNGRTWEPEFIFQVNPGSTIEFEPPKERAFFQPSHPRGETVFENDAGYPFDHGILIVDSTIDTNINPLNGQVPPPTNEIRITARMLDPFTACI